MAWTKDELAKRAYEIFDKEIGWDAGTDAWDKLNVTDKPARCTLVSMFGAGSWRDLKNVVRDYCFDASETTTEYLSQTNDQLKSKLKKQQNLNHIMIDTFRAELSRINFSPSTIPPLEKTKPDLAFHVLRSDDQVGEVVDKNMVQGIGEYNTPVFIDRINRLAERICVFREQDKNSLGLNKLVIHMLGDMVEGETIYKGQAYFIDLPVIEQLAVALRENVNFILTMASAFPQVEIFAVMGNHGRVGGKGDNHPRTNFDNILYMMMQMALEKQKNVKMFVSYSPTMLVRHGNFNFALNHNDDVKSYMGTPYYGLERKARRLSDLFGMTVHYKVGGHFHTPANLGDETIMNGTLVGGSELSINKMNVSSRPCQKIFYFDDKHGINRESNLYLDEPVVLTADENGIYTSYV